MKTNTTLTKWIIEPSDKELAQESKKKKLGIEINGAVYSSDNSNIRIVSFLDSFLEFVESKGWIFGGGVKQIDEEGKELSSDQKTNIIQLSERGAKRK